MSTKKLRAGFIIILMCLSVILVMGSMSTEAGDSKKGAHFNKSSDDPPPCFTMDRSRPEWLGAPTSVEQHLEDHVLVVDDIGQGVVGFTDPRNTQHDQHQHNYRHRGESHGNR